jgi:hypothetical protein
MQRINVLVVAAYRQTLGVGKRFLQLGGEFVETHESTPVMFGLKPLLG